MQNRQNVLTNWLEQILGSREFNLTPLAGDASFRRYFRLYHQGETRVVMDAPPDKERIQPFLKVANLFDTVGVCTPRIHAVNSSEGFALLEDFGDRLFLNGLNKETADKLYKSAMDTITNLHSCSVLGLAQFNKQFILQELSLFTDWFLQAYLQLDLSSQEDSLIKETFDWLSDELEQQSKVLIHRDYHSRNIMLLDESNALGIIDFQDAMLGPFTYDLVSLLKDCYIQWPNDQIKNWLDYFYHQSTIAQNVSFAEFNKAFNYCGLQRHLKVLGIFSRLHLRDNKPNYLQDLPLTLHYVVACLERYAELETFYRFVQSRIQLP